jgi:thymidylate kinase
VAFEGRNGAGKTTMVARFAELLRRRSDDIDGGGLAGGADHLGEVGADGFAGRASGMRPGSFGFWAYHLRHDRAAGISWSGVPGSQDAEFLTRQETTPLTIELLHLAAQLETIDCEIWPVLNRGGWAVVDRCWLSIYAELRMLLDADETMRLVAPLRARWDALPWLQIVHLSRGVAGTENQRRLDSCFHEAISVGGDAIIQIRNDDDVAQVVEQIVNRLRLAGRQAP